jgi:leader peptidase (prepilin peptidase) / N-methyltransferase
MLDMELLQTISVLDGYNSELVLCMAVVLGLCVGSFLNVVIYRLPIMLHKEWTRDCTVFLSSDDSVEQDKDTEKFDLTVPSSHCFSCKKPIKIWQNIPVVSFLLLKGKCGQCHSKISLRYVYVEIIAAVLALVTASIYGATPLAICLMIFCWSLLCLTMIDYDHQLLPDSITLPLLWLGLMVNSQSGLVELSDAFWGAVVGYLSLWSVFWVFKLCFKREGMGYGDFKLLAALGAWLGVSYILPIILISSCVGSVVGISMIIFTDKDRSTPIPFGPYLAFGGIVSLFLGEHVLKIVG